MYQFQLLKDKIMFLIDIFHSIQEEKLKKNIIQRTAKELDDMRLLFKDIVMSHTTLIQQEMQVYIKNLELVKVFLKLLSIYYDAQSLLPVFEECLTPLLNKFFTVFKNNLKDIFHRSTHIIEAEQVLPKELEALLTAKNKISCIFCSNMEILASIISAGEYLFRRNKTHKTQKELKTVLTNILIDTLELILS